MACDGQDVAMVECGDIKVVFNQPLGEIEEPPARSFDDEPEEKPDPYDTLFEADGGRPTFNNE